MTHNVTAAAPRSCIVYADPEVDPLDAALRRLGLAMELGGAGLLVEIESQYKD